MKNSSIQFIKKFKLLFLISLALIFNINLSFAQEGRFTNRVFDNFTVTNNIEFSRAAAIGSNITSLYLDFYEPENDNMSYRPLVIEVFGGAFVAGNRKFADMVAYADSLTHYGYTCASIDYRLIPISQISKANVIREVYMTAQDVSSAVRFFKSNFEEYKIDTNQIFIIGSSSGSIACLSEYYYDDEERPAETYTYPDLGGINSSGFDSYHSNTSSVAGIISQWGAILDLSIIDEDELSPICFIHSIGDYTVPYTQGYSAFPLFSYYSPYLYGSYAISQRLDSMDIGYELHTLNSNVHAYYLDNYARLIPEKFDTCFNIVLSYLAKHNHYIDGINNNISKQNNISVYPNPTSDIIHVNIKSNLASNTNNHIIVYNTLGTIVKKSPISVSEMTISLSNLPSGIYILETGNDVYSRVKVVKR